MAVARKCVYHLLPRTGSLFYKLVFHLKKKKVPVYFPNRGYKKKGLFNGYVHFPLMTFHLLPWKRAICLNFHLLIFRKNSISSPPTLILPFFTTPRADAEFVNLSQHPNNHCKVQQQHQRQEKGRINYLHSKDILM